MAQALKRPVVLMLERWKKKTGRSTGRVAVREESELCLKRL